MIKRAAMFAIVLLIGSAPAWAHHAFSAEFDMSKPMKLQGTLAKWEMINPHSWFHIDVKDQDGKLVRWMIEGGSPNQLIRLGVSKKTLAVGTELLVEGYLAREGGNKGVARNFTLLDGRRLFLGGSTPPEPADAGAK